MRCVVWQADIALIVALSERDLRHAAIEAGLSAGDAVITHPGDRIRDGVSVIERQSLE